MLSLNFTDPTVRDNSAEALGTAMKVVSEKQIMAFMTDLDNIKMTKVSVIILYFLAAVDR
jgi:cytoskeleton-associated protein 5